MKQKFDVIDWVLHATEEELEKSEDE